MSRSFIVRRKQRLVFPKAPAEAVERLDPRHTPLCNGARDDFNDPAPMVLPVGTEISISNSSGERKKL
jgi:hypothetical protein